MCVCVFMFILYVCLCTICVHGASASQKRVLGPSELPTIVSSHAGAGDLSLEKQQVPLTAEPSPQASADLQRTATYLRQFQSPPTESHLISTRSESRFLYKTTQFLKY